MTEAEKRAIAEGQLQQIAEHKARQQREAAEDAEFARCQAQIIKAMSKQAYEVRMMQGRF